MSDPWEKAVLDRRKEGWSYQQIADLHGTTRNVIAGVIYRSGATRERLFAGKAYPVALRRRVQNLRREGWKFMAISSETGVAISTAQAWCKGLGTGR